MVFLSSAPWVKMTFWLTPLSYWVNGWTSSWSWNSAGASVGSEKNTAGGSSSGKTYKEIRSVVIYWTLWSNLRWCRTNLTVLTGNKAKINPKKKFIIIFPSTVSGSGCLTADRVCSRQLCGTMSTLCWPIEFTSPPSTPPSVCSTTCRAAPWCWSCGLFKVRVNR